MDRNCHGGGILLYVREDIPSKILEYSCKIEALFIEINLRKVKWLLSCSYNPSKSTITNHLDKLGYFLATASISYDKIILIGDLNSEANENPMIEFCHINSFKHLVKSPTCFKNPNNPSCIDVILTNSPKSFQNTSTLDTGLSDFHHMTLTVLKTQFPKLKPKVVEYRSYKNFSNDTFRNELLNELSRCDIRNLSFSKFTGTNMKLIDRLAPIKQRYVRSNQQPFINKKVTKSIMNRSRLRNRFLKNPSEENRKAYNRQRNYCVNLVRREKRKYFQNLNIKDVTDNKIFWKSIKTNFSDKNGNSGKISLVDDDIIISNDTEIAETFSNYFSSVITSLDIPFNKELLSNAEEEKNPLKKAILTYKDHPGIQSINSKHINTAKFSFKEITEEEVSNEILSLHSAKASQKSDIPTKILKVNVDIYSFYLQIILNNCLKNSIFPEEMKTAEVTPVFKKNDRISKENYRPVSILPVISKIFERCIYNQLETFFSDKLSKFQCGFRKGFSAQHCLIKMLETWRSAVDKKDNFVALLTDLSKAFDCLNHDLLISKLKSYGLDEKSLCLMYSYLHNRSQRVKIGNVYSRIQNVETGVPQGSILGPLLFNIHIADLFDFLPDVDIANFADDSTPYVTNIDINEGINDIERITSTLIEWFSNNYMKANPDKCHLLTSSSDEVNLILNGNLIQASSSEKLLGIKIDCNLSFNEHVEDICEKASQKLSALARISPYLNESKRRILFKSFISSQFGYCPLVWMFHSRKLNNRINRIHEKALRIVYQDNVSLFQELLEKDKSVSIHQRNLQVLAIEVFKVKIGTAPKILAELFNCRSNNYSLRNPSDFDRVNKNTVKFGENSLTYLAPIIWDQVPKEMKLCNSLNQFKKAIKSFVFQDCPCRLCKIYIQGVGFL